VELSAATDGEEVGRGTQLLAAIRGALEGEVVTTAELLEAVNNNDELPFGAWGDGKGLDARTLARMLKPYGIRPRTVRIGEETAKGYHAADLADIFARYLSPSQASHPDQASPEEPHGNSDVTGVTDVTLPAGTANGGPPGDIDSELARLTGKFLDGDEIDLAPLSQPNGAYGCECDPPMLSGDGECSKCGRVVA
jgi:hypothetical protein